jgi:hypothetical protein
MAKATRFVKSAVAMGAGAILGLFAGIIAGLIVGIIIATAAGVM